MSLFHPFVYLIVAYNMPCSQEDVTVENALSRYVPTEVLSSYAVKKEKSGKGSAMVLAQRLLALWQKENAEASPSKKTKPQSVRIGSTSKEFGIDNKEIDRTEKPKRKRK